MKINTFLFITLSVCLSLSVEAQESLDSIDIELLEIDIEDVKSGYYEKLNLPMSIAAFGVKPYPGGGGAVDIDFKIRNKQFVGASFSIGESKEANTFYEFSNSHNVFCNVVILTDFYDEIEYTHASNLISSRNHPNYLGIGTVKTSNQEIDYVSFVDISKENLSSYVVISGKLFNLVDGNSILIIPQKDFSLRYIQFNLQETNFSAINEELEEELSKDYYINYIFNKLELGK